MFDLRLYFNNNQPGSMFPHSAAFPLSLNSSPGLVPDALRLFFICYSKSVFCFPESSTCRLPVCLPAGLPVCLPPTPFVLFTPVVTISYNIIIHHVSSPTDEMVPPEDIEKMARAVLAIQLPQSLDQIQSMINDINNLLSNATNSQDNLNNLVDHTQTAKDLLQKTQELKSVSENMK